MLAKFGLPVPAGTPVLAVVDVAAAAEKLIQATSNDTVVVKAQIHAGGRGRGVFKSGLKGGVKVCTSPAEVPGPAERVRQSDAAARRLLRL